jgi:hypothetical protein
MHITIISTAASRARVVIIRQEQLPVASCQLPVNTKQQTIHAVLLPSHWQLGSEATTGNW